MHLNVLQVYVQIELSLENLELFPAFVLFGISASLQSYKLNVFALRDANTWRKKSCLSHAGACRSTHDRPKLECSFGAPKATSTSLITFGMNFLSNFLPRISEIRIHLQPFASGLLFEVTL